jgi:hypothetical protein
VPYLSGVLTGILLTILVVFVIDHVGDEPGSRDIANWGFIGEKVGASVKDVGEEVRREVHEATSPDSGQTQAPAAPDAP